MNENYGLVPATDALRLFLIYSLVSIGIGIISVLLVKEKHGSFILAFIILTFYFLFGVFKDFGQKFEFLRFMTRYSVFLPLMALALIFIITRLKRTKGSLVGLYRYSKLLLIILTGLEIIFLAVNYFQKPLKNFEDPNHELITNIKIPGSAKKPKIFWIVLDEYASSRSFKNKWGFENPLDGQLRNKGFFIADTAVSPYSYTHFSLASTLSMQYLSGLDSSNLVDYRDMIFATKTLYNNNVVEFLRLNGYEIHNLSIFDVKDHPALPFAKFKSDPSELISNTTFSSRVNKDIGWNFYQFFSGGKAAAERVVKQELKQMATRHQMMMNESKELVKQSAGHSEPSLYMIHYMMTHNPFLFRADGSFDDKATFTSRQGYINTITFANRVVNDLVDSILSTNKGQDFLILIQSDHGFRYEEYEPEFETESCNIFYAVYCSDNDYSPWTNNISSVNSFRIIFNKYFQTSFPLLPRETHILRYKQQKN